jgi:hypothetical protein
MFRQLLECPQFVTFFEEDASNILEQYCKDTYVHPAAYGISVSGPL